MKDGKGATYLQNDSTQRGKKIYKNKNYQKQIVTNVQQRNLEANGKVTVKVNIEMKFPSKIQGKTKQGRTQNQVSRNRGKIAKR